MTNNTSPLNELLRDIECLGPVTQALDKVNIFEILRTSHTEIRHSNILGWLMDPRQNHGLGESVLRGIVHLVTADTPVDYSGFRIHREWNHIDLLAYSEGEKYIVCIENKTYSGEHSNQLKRYRERVETTFPDYRKVYIYLTRKGTASSDPEHWTAIGYRDILRVIGKARETVKLKPEVAMILDHYDDTVKEMTGGDDGLRKQCEEIYRKHRKAIDQVMKYGTGEDAEDSPQAEERETCEVLWQKYSRELREIWNYRPGKATDPVTDMISLWAELRTQEDAIRINPDKTSDRYYRFTTGTMSDILPDAVGHRSGWNTENFYFYELRNVKRPDEHEVFLEFVLDKKDIPEDLKASSDRISRIHPLVHESKQFRVHFATDHAFLKDNADEQTVMKQLDRFLKEIKDYERDIAEGLEDGEEEQP